MNFALLFFIIYHLVTVDVSAMELADTVSPMELLSTLNIPAQPSRAEIKFRYNEDGDCDSNHDMTLCGYGTTWINVSSSVKKCEIIPELLTAIFALSGDIAPLTGR